MNRIDRRKFLKMAGASSALAAAATLPAAGWLLWKKDVLEFRAVTGLPQPPLPGYASYVIRGKVDLNAGSGTITKALYAGPPDGMSSIAWPGLSREVRVTGVQRSGDVVQITGLLEDPSQLQKGESPNVDIIVNRVEGTARAQFFGMPVTMTLK